MKILVLGRGKTGALVAEVARERGHTVEVMGAAENPAAKGLTATALSAVDAVIDFTTPAAVLGNIERCAELKKSIVVGTTGWRGEIDRARGWIERSGSGMVYAANFSLGVNLFFDVVRAAAPALRHGYSGSLEERHHVHKKDAPSGTALALQSLLKDAAGREISIHSVREGDVMGTHSLTLDSPADTITLVHDAKSRRGFAEGAVRAAEWLHGKKGFYDFGAIWRELL